METENSSPKIDLKEGIRFKPVKLEEIPPPSREDLELMLAWNLKLLPFLLENYDAIFKRKGKAKGEAHSNPEIIHVIASDFCPNASRF